jgi:hypothetical protein
MEKTEQATMKEYHAKEGSDELLVDFSRQEQRKIIHRIDRRLVVLLGLVRPAKLERVEATKTNSTTDVLRLSHGSHQSFRRRNCRVWSDARISICRVNHPLA